MGLLFVGPDLPGQVDAVVSHQDSTFVAISGGVVLGFERGLATGHRYAFPDGKRILRMEVLGDNLLVLREGGLTVLPLDLGTRRSVIEFTSQASCMLHPHTYLNKVVVGFLDGRLELWNFRTAKLIYAFESVKSDATSAIRCLSQSPVLDIIAVGFEDGKVLLIDLRKDEMLFGINGKSSVTAITFRSDLPEERPQMAVASADGQLSVWDLEGRRLWQLVPVAHAGGIASAYFLPGQPMLLTAGCVDNALKVWIVEGEEIRLLKGRSGHSAPPQLVRFHEEDGFGLLSGGGQGDKSVRYTSLLKDSQCHELSQGSIDAKARKMREQDGRSGWIDPAALKLPPVTGLAYFGRKDLKWDNLVTCHEGLNFARTWRASHKVIGAHKLKSSDGAAVAAVAMSSCGNFALIGSAMGTVDIYNIQSGLLRKTIPVGEAEPSPVRGLAVDAVNKEGLAVYASGRLVVFDFATGPKAAKVLCVKEALASHVSAFAFNPDNGLAAVAVDAGKVLVFDLAGRRIVRHFASSTMALVRDLAFSPDGKSLVGGDANGLISTWDLPSGLLVDSFTAPSPVLSVACSPTGQFMASSHEGDRAIHLWSSSEAAVSSRQSQPMHSVAEGLADRNLDRELVRLSSQPRSKWTQLLHLDSIKARNRVLQAEKAPERAPFFLDAAIIKETEAEAGKEKKKRDVEGRPVVEATANETQLPFEALLSDYMRHRDTSPLLDYFREAGNASISFSVHALSPALLPAMLSLLTAMLSSHQHYEMVQTLLGLTLSAHREQIMGCDESKALLAELEAVQRGLWEERLEPLFQKALCLAAFCKDRF